MSYLDDLPVLYSTSVKAHTQPPSGPQPPRCSLESLLLPKNQDTAPSTLAECWGPPTGPLTKCRSKAKFSSNILTLRCGRLVRASGSWAYRSLRQFLEEGEAELQNQTSGTGDLPEWHSTCKASERLMSPPTLKSDKWTTPK